MSRALLFVGGTMFRQSIARLGLSIDEGTENVPADGRYYLIADRAIQKSYKVLRDALRPYEALKAGRLATEAAALAAGSAVGHGEPHSVSALP